MHSRASGVDGIGGADTSVAYYTQWEHYALGTLTFKVHMLQALLCGPALRHEEPVRSPKQETHTSAKNPCLPVTEELE